MSTRTPSTLSRRIAIGGVGGAFVGLLIGLALTAGDVVGLLLALAGMAIGATLAQGMPEPEPERVRLSELPPPADPAPGWLPDPLGGQCERLWDGSEWTRHLWRPAPTITTPRARQR